MPNLLTRTAFTAALAALTAAAATMIVRDRSAPPPTPAGHLILQIEGDAASLQVTRITKKSDPCGAARLQSAYAIVVRDAAGAELGRTPLDLSAFDLDPARLGGALRVEGCVVRDPHVATLANVPYWPTATHLEIVHGAQRLGTLEATRYTALLSAGTPR